MGMIRQMLTTVRTVEIVKQNMTDQTAKPISGPGRDPLDRITMSCFIYIARMMDIRKFASFFFGIIEHSDVFAHGLEDKSKKTFEAEASKYKDKSKDDPKDYSFARQFINEIILSRAVETFNLYIIMLLEELFLTKPEMLKSENPIDAAKVFELRDFDNVVSYLVERKLHELGYKGLYELNKYIETRTGLKLFKSDDIFNEVLLATEIRNLIAHNDCRKNERFASRLAPNVIATLTISESLDGGPHGGKVILSDGWVRDASEVLDSVVFDFDEAAAKKFGLNTLNRMTSFLFRK
jgi:hypothetical protein